MASIKNILFDLGNVLLSLNFLEANRRFQALLGTDFEPAYEGSMGLFKKLEVGRLSQAEFLAGVRAQSNRPELSDEEILYAWSAILGDLPARRLHMLEELSQHYRLLLLSNTNAIHMAQFDRYLTATHGLSLHDLACRYFRGFYLSYEIHLSKPDPAVFRYVLRDAGIAAAETLFVDDRAENIRSAESLGIRGYRHDPRQEVAEVLPKVLGE